MRVLGGLSLWHVVIGVLLFWVVVLLLMSSSLHQSDDGTQNIERQLFDAMRKLDTLKTENKKLRDLADELRQLKNSADREAGKDTGKQPQESPVEPVAKELRPPVSEFAGSAVSKTLNAGEPSLEAELARRAAENNVRELMFYITSQLSRLKTDLSTVSKFDQHWIQTKVDRLTDISETATDYKRTIFREFHNLTKATDAWRSTEARSLAELVQKRIHYLQNPTDCHSARKLVCNINKGCGFGCQLHHLAYCFVVAYGTNRTLVIASRGWRYSPSGGWEKYFLPASDTCTNTYGASAKMWTSNVEDIQVVEMPIVDSLHPRPPYMPQAIPADLADRLIRLHGHPFVWWIGQFMSYLFRFQPWLQEDIDKMTKKLNFYGPIVGVHVRRTDKVGSEAAFHGIDEYMAHVEDYFKSLEKRQHKVKRRVYIATDDPSVIDEAKTKYSNYDVIGDTTLSRSAGLSSRYSDDSLRGVILDIHFLSKTNYLVCTFSSQVCRLAYELMQTMHSDASSYFRSLDDIYYFGGQNGHYQVAVLEHSARPGTDELDLRPGDAIGVAGNHWDGFSKGKNERTGRVGTYPSYKVQEHMDIVDFPTYPKATDTLAH